MSKEDNNGRVIDFVSAANSKKSHDSFEKEADNIGEILDYLDELFPEEGGIIITVSQGSVCIASSIEEYEMTKNLLISAMVKVLETGDKDE